MESEADEGAVNLFDCSYGCGSLPLQYRDFSGRDEGVAAAGA